MKEILRRFIKKIAEKLLRWAKAEAKEIKKEMETSAIEIGKSYLESGDLTSKDNIAEVQRKIRNTLKTKYKEEKEEAINDIVDAAINELLKIKK